ncbi:MAG TPA: hypothetical protein VF598_10470 [Hymenobacter sp.]
MHELPLPGLGDRRFGVVGHFRYAPGRDVGIHRGAPAGPLCGAHPPGRVAGVAAGEPVETDLFHYLTGRVQGKGVLFLPLVGQPHQAALAVVG